MTNAHVHFDLHWQDLRDVDWSAWVWLAMAGAALAVVLAALATGGSYQEIAAPIDALTP